MSYSNANYVKFDKKDRFNFEESQDRLGKGRKLNKTKKTSNKRDQWEEQE